MAEPVVLLPESDTPKEVSIAESLIPWRKDDNRARFLGYLACGFSVEESLYNWENYVMVGGAKVR